MRIKVILISMLLGLNIFLSAQKYQYEVSLEPLEIPGLGGIQSFAFAQSNGEWLVLGGRLDGLHRLQPFTAFDESGNNTQIIVINPITQESWKASYNNIPAGIREQLSSTNMQFYQEEGNLILTGGYAYSPTANDHITFPYITVIDVDKLISQVKNNSINSSGFMQITDQKFAVTGGYLEKIDDTYYLVGGQRFDGLYNPMGADFGPGFKQEYTDEIRPFNLNINAQNFRVDHLEETHDELHLHRRDYNLLPQIRNGKEELMVFSGVFQKNIDMPWLYPVEISKAGHQALENFTQRFNHYHCATLAIHNEEEDEMHNIFFGGIAQFYMDDAILVQDNDIPFVNTIADVSRSADGALTERVLETKMPELLGSSSEFIMMPSSPTYRNGVLMGDKIGSNPIDIGYIFGGIKSSMPNIFFNNNGTQSQASNTIYKVSISRKSTTSNSNPIINDNELLIYPNPVQNFVRMSINLKTLSNIEVNVYDTIGTMIGNQLIPKSELTTGKNYIVLEDLNVDYGMYLYKIKVEDQVIKRWVIWSN